MKPCQVLNTEGKKENIFAKFSSFFLILHPESNQET
jgi:hypothetical protein